MKRNVHFPTDISLLMDSTRKLVTSIHRLCEENKISGWREYKSELAKIKKQLRKIQKSKHSTSKNPERINSKAQQIKELYENYLSMVKKLLLKTKDSLNQLSDQELKRCDPKIMEYMNYAELFIDQITRRVLNGEKIPHDEKVFSIFEKDTEWISKGKSGIRQELGINVCIVTDELGLILNHRVMRKETDSSIVVPLIKETKQKYNTFNQCSFDKGFHSPENQRELLNILNMPILPKKGKLSIARKKIEYSVIFKKAKKHHPAIESSIFSLKNHGLDICPDKGKNGFNRYTALGIVARNLQIIGNRVQQNLLKREKSKKIRTA